MIIKHKKMILGSVMAWVAFVGTWHVFKPVPEGLSYASVSHPVAQEDVAFLFDETYEDARGTRVSQQEIFDEIFAMIDDAQTYILIDFFLFNDYGDGNPYRNLTQELHDALIKKKQEYPAIRIDLITDDINTMYGTRPTPQLQSLADAGIHIIYTNLLPLRDSNPLYSAWWRTFAQWFGVGHRGMVPHPFSKQQDAVSLRAYLRLLNFKANHRKVILADTPSGNIMTLITSANPHDGSAAHSNIALKVRNVLAKDLYISEQAVAQLSGDTLAPLPVHYDQYTQVLEADTMVQLLTEGKIKKEILAQIDHTGAGERIDIGMFYFSDRAIVHALRRAANRGVVIRVILDPNKDAFGHQKNGIPNRQVAQELREKTHGKIQIRWHQTHGEQFHTKILIITKRTGKTIVVLGSANYTRRNIGDYNLETDVLLITPTDGSLAQRIHAFFRHVWDNEDQHLHTVAYDAYASEALWRTIVYRLQEALGLSTF